MVEHDGCIGCKYEALTHLESPCKDCRETHLDGGYADYDDKYEPAELEEDVVNHPYHYCQEGSMECIDEMIAVFGIEAVQNFCLLNVWKYRKRAVFKNGEEDMKKSDWYMNKWKELEERKKNERKGRRKTEGLSLL